MVPVSKPDFLTGCADVARLAAPPVSDAREQRIGLVAEQRAGLMTPAAANHMRVAESRILAKEARRRLSFTGEQFLAALDFPRCQSNLLPHDPSFVSGV